MRERPRADPGHTAVTRPAGDPLRVPPPCSGCGARHGLRRQKCRSWERASQRPAPPPHARPRAGAREQEPGVGSLGDTGQLPALHEPLRALVWSRAVPAPHGTLYRSNKTPRCPAPRELSGKTLLHHQEASVRLELRRGPDQVGAPAGDARGACVQLSGPKAPVGCRTPKPPVTRGR